ncbi:MAG: hypothetical protein JWR38_1188 [Mucilaginibacter sp.]|nr:hypothetical protein [Mucilaginibacter sp.]
MKKIKTFIPALLIVMGVILISGCEKLKLQKDFNRSTTDTLDAHVGKNAWAYLKSRAYSNTTDTVFRRMYDAIIYSGIDTNLYMQQNKTYLIYTNAAVTTAKTGLWATYLTSKKVAAKSFKDYSAADLKNYLLFLILDGQYSHYNLPLTDVEVKTLAPVGIFNTNFTGFIIPAFTANNPNSTLKIKVLNSSPGNTSDYPLQINSTTNVYSSDYLTTNGVIQVMNTPVSPIYPK